MNTQYDGVLALPAEVAGLQETKLTDAGQQRYKKQLLQDGWNAVFGKPLVKRKRGRGSVPPGGVAIISRSHIPIQRVPPTTDLAQRLWDTGRFVHAVAPAGKAGKTAVHFFSIYGFSNAERDPQRRVQNEELLHMVFTYAAGLGQVPIFMFGDWNTSPRASTAMEAALGSGNYWDIEEFFAATEGRAAHMTCFVRETSVGSRIDSIITNSIGMQSVQGIDTLGAGPRSDVHGVPTHRAVVCEANYEVYERIGVQFRVTSGLPSFTTDPDVEGEGLAQ